MRKPGAVQNAPDWVEAVTFIPADTQADAAAPSVFRIRLARPGGHASVLFFRLFFNDQTAARPAIVAWDESGSQLLRSGPLGTGIDLESSESVMIPMHGITTIDVEVPGDGNSVRGAYLEWMTSSEMVHASGVGSQDAVPQPFAATLPLHAPAQDAEEFGTVTASLSADLIRIGSTSSQAAAFEFGLESQPLLALITFEIAGPRIDSPPEVIANGENVGARLAGYAGIGRSRLSWGNARHRQPNAIPIHRVASRTEDRSGKRPPHRDQQHHYY